MLQRSSSAVLVAVLALGLAACDAGQLDDARDAAQQAASEAASRLDDLADQLPTDLPDPGDVLPDQSPAATQEARPDAQAQSPQATEQVTQQATPAPEPEEGGGVPLWAWALLALLGVLLVWAVGVAVARGRARRARRARLRDAALRDAAWLVDVALELRATVGADARARDVRVRTDRIVETLRELRTDAGDRAVLAADELAAGATRLGDVLVAELDDAAAGREAVADLDRTALVDEVRDAAGRLQQAVRPRHT